MLSINTHDIILAQTAENKQDAIKSIANGLLNKGYVEGGYVNGMLAREAQNTTFLGNGIAIPHGTTDTRDQIKQTGVILHHFPKGVNWGDDNTVYLAIGIAAKSDQHLEILKMLTKVLSADGVEQQLQNASTAQTIVDLLTGKVQTEMLLTTDLIKLDIEAQDMSQLTAAAADLIKNQVAAGDTFAEAIATNKATHLGQGLWLNASNQGVNKTTLSFVSTSLPLEHSNKPVKGLLCLASNNQLHLKTLDLLIDLIAKQQVEKLFSANPEQVINLLTKEILEGSQEVFTILNPHGLHARPGAMLVNTAKKFTATIQLARIDTPDKTVNAKSLMKVMTLGVKFKDQLQVTAQGEDAEQALLAIGQAIEKGLGETIQ
ncbi:MAG: phosphocarrier protein FPr [Psychromonas sp.]|jgi:phosphocarrier protein FPr|uniref:fused PTS fructose transporter subunit IIA/HPr protein n=1 Tax=Psychromonas sp. TaxID=1884585 RepID=UPI0039E423CA